MPGGLSRLARCPAALRRSVRVLRQLSAVDEDERAALLALARSVAAEHVVPGRSAGIDPSAMVHPLATIRFADRVEIGPRASVGPYCCVWGGWSRTWARVGAGALLSPGVVLVAGNHGLAGTGPVRDQPFTELDVEVGPGAWLGSNATVVGVRVGAGAVVAAGSVVLEDVPDLAIVAGAPARVVGSRS